MCTFSALTLKSGIFSTAFLKSSSFSILRCLNNGLFTGHELSKTYFTLCMSRIEGGGFFLLRISSSWYLGASSSLLIMKRKFLAPKQLLSVQCLRNWWHKSERKVGFWLSRGNIYSNQEYNSSPGLWRHKLIKLSNSWEKSRLRWQDKQPTNKLKMKPE